MSKLRVLDVPFMESRVLRRLRCFEIYAQQMYCLQANSYVGKKKGIVKWTTNCKSNLDYVDLEDMINSTRICFS